DRERHAVGLARVGVDRGRPGGDRVRVLHVQVHERVGAHHEEAVGVDRLARPDDRVPVTGGGIGRLVLPGGMGVGGEEVRDQDDVVAARRETAVGLVAHADVLDRPPPGGRVARHAEGLLLHGPVVGAREGGTAGEHEDEGETDGQACGHGALLSEPVDRDTPRSVSRGATDPRGPPDGCQGVALPRRPESGSGDRRVDVPSLETLVVEWSYAAIVVGLVLGNLGLPVPEETILAVAGYAAWRGILWLPAVVALGTVSAILGDNLGYWLGRRYGREVIARYGRRIGVT